MKMTLLHLAILLHYRTRRDREYAWHSPERARSVAVLCCGHELVYEGLLEPVTTPQPCRTAPYRVTERGVKHIEALIALPLPAIPDPEDDIARIIDPDSFAPPYIHQNTAKRKARDILAYVKKKEERFEEVKALIASDGLPRCDCGHLFDICDAPNCDRIRVRGRAPTPPPAPRKK